MSKENQKVLEPGSDESIAASTKALEDVVLKLAGNNPDANGNPPKELTPDASVTATTVTQPGTVQEPVTATAEAQRTAGQVTEDGDKRVSDLTAKLAETERKLADIESRFNKASGDYGGKLEKQSATIRELNEFNQVLQGRLDKITTENAELKSGKTKAAESVNVDDSIDDDLKDVAPKSAEKLKKLIQGLTEKIKGFEGGAQGTLERVQYAEQLAQQQAIARYNDVIVASVPNAKELLGDTAYLEFISKPDEFGRTLKEVIDSGTQTLNPSPLIASMQSFMKATKKELTAEEKEAARVAAEATEADKKAKIAAHGAPSSSAGTVKEQQLNSPAAEAAKRNERVAAYERKLAVNANAITAEEATQYQKDLQADLGYKLSLKR